MGGIFLRKPPGRFSPGTYWLSQRGALTEMARHLYEVLRAADHGNHNQLWIQALPADSGGLTTAIKDRLRRAAAKR